jgi:hypothetical protein
MRNTYLYLRAVSSNRCWFSPMSDLVAEQAAGNASDDCSAGVVAALLYL